MRILFLLNALFYFSVASAEGDWYTGGTVGSTSFDTDVTVVSGAILDKDDSGMSLFIGKNINDRFSIEGFYFDSGEITLSGSSGDQFFDASSNTTYEFTTDAVISQTNTSVGVAGKLYGTLTDNLLTYFKIGLHQWDEEFKLDVGTSSATVTDDGIDPIYGLGVDYKLTDNFSLLGEYNRLDFDDLSVTSINFGIKYTLN